MKPASLLAILISVTLAIAGQTTLKRGMTLVGAIDGARLQRPGRVVLDVASRWQVWVRLGAYVLSAASWIYTLSRVPLSLAYPFLGLSYVGVAAVAVLALDEWLAPRQWIGIMLLVVGVVTVALTG